MTRTSPPALATLVVLATLSTHARVFGQAGNNEAWVLAHDAARTEAARGNYARARSILQTAFNGCDSASVRSVCRASTATALGDLVRIQADADRLNRDSLFRESVGFYDVVLNESPNSSDALYKKALAYRSMGPHEWQESFFRKAANRPGASRDVFLSFLGDYLAGHQRWQEALESYRQALALNPREDGSRGGLIDALRGIGPSSIPELLRLGDDWMVQDPALSAEAYSAALVLAFSRDPRDPQTAPAMIGLVSVQALNGRMLGQMPSAVPQDWEPCRQLQDFLGNSEQTVRQDSLGQRAPTEHRVHAEPTWWLAASERRVTLAAATLARGRQLLSEGRPQRAEEIWRAGVRLVPPNSGVHIDLQRELAMLYFSYQTLDADGRKFTELEQQMFAGKGLALITGDLEAAQRFHTALGLIYAAKGVWRSPPVRNARDQITWALEKADLRAITEHFYQPLPDLRFLLAKGLDSIGESERARQVYIDAAAAYYDVDDFSGVIASLRAARAVPEIWPANRQDSLWAFRYSQSVISQLFEACPDSAPLIWVSRAGGTGRFNTGGFRNRQQFKINADCASFGPPSRSWDFAAAAFRVVDSGRVALVGAADVRRFESVVNNVLMRFGMSLSETHFEHTLPQGASFPVSLPGESRPAWLTLPPDQLLGTRIAVVIGKRTPITRLLIDNGFVELYSATTPAESMLRQVRLIPGLRGLHVSIRGTQPN
jgi:tetratricopeptide (TPR) repeat protein